MTFAPYLDPSLFIESRVADLLARMNLVEKCAQLIGPFGLEEVEFDQLNCFHSGT